MLKVKKQWGTLYCAYRKVRIADSLVSLRESYKQTQSSTWLRIFTGKWGWDTGLNIVDELTQHLHQLLSRMRKLESYETTSPGPLKCRVSVRFWFRKTLTKRKAAFCICFPGRVCDNTALSCGSNMTGASWSRTSLVLVDDVCSIFTPCPVP